MNIFEQKLLKTTQKYSCKKCDYSSCSKSNLRKHLLTLKHEKTPFLNDFEQKLLKTTQYSCVHCNKIYKNRNGLWYHKQKCKPTTNNDTLVQYLIKENTDLKTMVIDAYKNIQPSSNNISNKTTNSHNKFNMNFFLNEQCKDAMNIMDFVDSLQIKLSDLEQVGELGYTNGISNIIIQNLKTLDIHKRPLHCNDTKRETIFIRDDDKWEKENATKEKLNKAINGVVNKNIRMIPEWKKENPDCVYSDSHKSNQYNHIIRNSFDSQPAYNEKIISNIAKEVKIQREEGG
jgi:hypothetical protein